VCPTNNIVGRACILIGYTNYKSPRNNNMIEALLFGIVLGMIPVTLSGLFVTAYLQYRRGDQLNL
jgi:cytochrome b6-f complex subunit 5|tara:strand:+ start:241 stop:435 length:195 start_codon:yes stop_codon:yes gene_type:complete